MKTMSDKYIPSWERDFNKWETEPEVWDKIEPETPEAEKEDIEFLRFMKSIDELEIIEEIELESEIENDN